MHSIGVETKQRYGELDLLRTLAIVMMIVYHTAYDLWAFYHWNIEPFAGSWKLLQRTTATLFLLLVGISFAISWKRSKFPVEESHDSPLRGWSLLYWKYFKRGLLIVGAGMLVMIATYVLNPETYVRFGILHMIGVSVLLLPIFASLKFWNLLLGILLLLIGMSMTGTIVPTSLFLPIGLIPPAFHTVDYYPLLPWFGVVLMGTTIGQWFYNEHLHWRNILIQIPIPNVLTWPGRHALLIYLIHQPIVLVILYITAIFV